jgi:hypothetical protein
MGPESSIGLPHTFQAELKDIQRFLLYCRGLKYKRGAQQVAFWKEHLQLGE